MLLNRAFGSEAGVGNKYLEGTSLSMEDNAGCKCCPWADISKK